VIDKPLSREAETIKYGPLLGEDPFHDSMYPPNGLTNAVAITTNSTY
jgi:hypothetical protein